jgi:hypothetical protein
MRVTVRQRIAVPLHRAWPKLADLAALETWAPDVTESRADPLRVGARRVAYLRNPAYGKKALVETVCAIEPHGFTYDIEGGIGPLRSIVTTWRLSGDGDHCTVQVSSVLQVAGPARLAGPLVWLAWRRQLRALAKGFARHAARE